MLSLEAGFGYLALQVRSRKPRRVEEMVNKICVRGKKWPNWIWQMQREQEREQERKEREGKQEKAYLRKCSCHE